ncbi:MAG: hypothetical protein U9R53_04775 [Chloroflexota bacterium]|nr:hypothetical protein [Chloroflexota bacterium]
MSVQNYKRKGRQIRFLRWVARVWSIIVLIFTITLLVSTAMESGAESLHLTYWLLLGLWCFSTLGLAAAWRWELIGAIIAVTALISREMVYLYLSGQVLVDFGMVWLPILFPAALYILVWVLERRSIAAQKPRTPHEVYE